jgi:LysM repeat protein
MKIRSNALIAITLLVLLTLLLAACEKDRPAPSPTRTAAGPAATATATAAKRSAQGNGTQAPAAAVGSSAAVTATEGSAATTQATQPTAGGQPSTYKVAAGDSLTSVAQRFGVTQEAILALNGLTDPNSLTTGQTLKIPGQGQQATSGSASGTSSGSGTSTGGTTTTDGATSYTVKAGDSLSKIAVRFGVTSKALAAANNISNPDKLTVGKVLVIPTGSSSTAGTGATTTRASGGKYVVQKGDTLTKIAARNGITLKQLMAANNITNPDRVYPGQSLTIP